MCILLVLTTVSSVLMHFTGSYMVVPHHEAHAHASDRLQSQRVNWCCRSPLVEVPDTNFIINSADLVRLGIQFAF